MKVCHNFLRSQIHENLAPPKYSCMYSRVMRTTLHILCDSVHIVSTVHSLLFFLKGNATTFLTHICFYNSLSTWQSVTLYSIMKCSPSLIVTDPQVSLKVKDIISIFYVHAVFNPGCVLLCVCDQGFLYCGHLTWGVRGKSCMYVIIEKCMSLQRAAK